MKRSETLEILKSMGIKASTHEAYSFEQAVKTLVGRGVPMEKAIDDVKLSIWPNDSKRGE